MLNMENFEQQDTGIENELEWSNGTVHFNCTVPTEKSGPPLKGGLLFSNLSIWTNKSIQFKTEIYGNFG